MGYGYVRVYKGELYPNGDGGQGRDEGNTDQWE